MSQTCALCIEEAKETEQKRAVPSCSKIAKNERHQLEQDHSKFNTTTARRRSVVHEASCVSTDASLDSSPQDEDVDEEECSITLSCLEFDGDEPSAITSSTTSSVPMKQGSKSPAPNCANKSTVPSSYPSSDSPSVSAASQKSHKSCSSKKSYSSHRSATCSEKNNVGRSSSETESKKSPKPSVSSRRSSSTTNGDEDSRQKGADILHRAEAALRRIKMLEKMGDRSATTSPVSTKEKTTTTPRERNDEASQERHRAAMPRQANSDLETTPNRRNATKSCTATKSTDSNLHPMNDLQIEAQSAEPQTMAPVTAIHLSPEIMTDYHQPPQGHNKEWMKYATTASARDAADENDDNGKKGIGKLKGRTLSKLTNNTRKMVWKVKQMPYCDQFGDHGIYTGHVNEDGKPDGSGTMKYENGVFYEGTWTDGCQDAAAQYARIRSGFTSWSGKGKSATKSGMVLPWNARKNDANDANEKNNVRGMEWMDLKGHSGRYTGEVNQDQVPHGNGIMKYDFGLIAEGEWVRGVLKEGPHDHLAAAIGSGQSVVSGMQRINSSLSLGSRSVGFPSGAVSAASGGMSVYMPQSIVGVQQFMPSQHAVMAHQNAMMSMYGSAVGSVYGGAATVYSSPGFAIPVQQMQYVPIQQQQQQQQVPPVSNIFIS